MIISHKYKFIFIKTTKTAGASIEVDLNKILGKDYVATPIFPPVDGHTAKNFRYGPCSNEFFYNHISASKVRSVIGEKLFHDYFSFCVERDPINKCISHYSMAKNSNHFNKKERNKNLTFEKYI
jgi:hypothetical protein